MTIKMDIFAPKKEKKMRQIRVERNSGPKKLLTFFDENCRSSSVEC